MTKTFKLLRRYVNDFNYSCCRISNSKGHTLQELMERFSGQSFQRYIPIIITLYLRLNAATCNNKRLFIFWDKRSSFPQQRAWNGFQDGDKWVADMNTKTGIMFEEPIYLRAKNYLDTYIDFTYEEDSAVGKYIKTLEENGTLRQDQPTAKTLF